METYKKYLIILVLLVLSFLAGKFSGSASSESRQVSLSETKDSSLNEQSQLSEVSNSEIIKPDGTIIKKSTKKNLNSQKQQTESVKIEYREKVVIKELRNEYLFTLGYQPNLPTQNELYQLQLQKRMFSEFYLGVGATYEPTTQYKTFMILGTAGF